MRWSLRDSRSRVLETHSEDVTAAPLSAVWLEKQDLPQADLRRHHVWFELLENGEILSQGSALFCTPQIYEYENPALSVRVEGDELVVTAAAYASCVELLNEQEDWVLSDNYFDMEAGEKRVRVLSGKIDRVRVRSVYDIG